MMGDRPITAIVVATMTILSLVSVASALPDMMDEQTVSAVERGLNYLAGTQRSNGAWLNSGGYGSYPASMTSLAGIAFMAGGSTSETGPYSRQVRRAMQYVLSIAESNDDGLISGPGGESRSMYGHGFSMLFLAQCYGVDINHVNEARIKSALDKGVVVTVRAQSDLGAHLRNAGGWIYTPRGASDEGSVTVTQLQALRACANVGIHVPRDTIRRAVDYLRYCQMPDGGICYSANSRNESRPAISAAAIACFYAAGVWDRPGDDSAEARMLSRLVQYATRNAMPESQDNGHWFYMQFYMAQAMYQRGGDDWASYYPRIRRRLLSMQAPDGSWSGDGVGTTYGTAIAVTILQLPYAYLPICQR